MKRTSGSAEERAEDKKESRKKKEKIMTAAGIAVCAAALLFTVFFLVYSAVSSKKDEDPSDAEMIVGTWVSDDGKTLWLFDEYEKGTLTIVVKERAEDETGMASNREYLLNEKTKRIAVASAAGKNTYFSYVLSDGELTLTKDKTVLHLKKTASPEK